MGGFGAIAEFPIAGESGGTGTILSQQNTRPAGTRFFLGLGTGATVYRLGSAGNDDGIAVVARVETQPFSPGGIGGEAIFTAIMPVIVYTGAVSVKFTPIVDGIVYDGTIGANAAVTIDLLQPADGRRAKWRGDIGLSIPYVRDGLDRGRYALRGTWFQLRVEVTSVIGDDALGNPGTVILEGCDLEHDVVGVTVERVRAPAYP